MLLVNTPELSAVPSTNSTLQPRSPVLSEVHTRPCLPIFLTNIPSTGLLASAILKMDGISGMAGWRWIFILEGIVTFLLGCLAAVFLPADIPSAKFLNEEEVEFARE